MAMALPVLVIVLIVVALIVELTVELPMVSADVLRVTLAPTLISVDIFAVDGSLAVAKVPVVRLEALDA